MPNTKYVFFTGGVVSSLGKGIAASSLGVLFKNQGYRVAIQKFDPYLNMDPGTMSPYQHGEVFVTDDGCETDLDLGHYERFIDTSLSRDNNITSGMVYWDVLNKEQSVSNDSLMSSHFFPKSVLFVWGGSPGGGEALPCATSSASSETCFKTWFWR